MASWGLVFRVSTIISQSPEHTSRAHRALGVTVGVQGQCPHCPEIFFHRKPTIFF